MLGNGNQVFADLWSGSYTEKTVLSGSEEQLRQRLEKHVWKLASDIGPRNTARSECLQEAAAYVQDQFQRSGFSPTSQEFSTFTGHRVRNIEVRIPGVALAEAIVVGAHYDSIDIPEGCPGANDNASGVAALIEMAALCAQKEQRPRHSLRFVAFTNEEPPYFGGPQMGSYVYVQELKRTQEKPMGMICLETVGCYSTQRNSQRVPDFLKAIYGNDVANFIAFTGNPESRKFLEQVLYAFRTHSSFPSEGLAAPVDLLPDLTLSDNRCFWEAGFPAIMVTDTVFMRYGDHYHRATDTADRLNYPALAKVTLGLADAVWQVANAPEPR